MRKALCLAAVVWVGGCSDDGGSAGSSGAIAGTGGAVAGMAGSVAGVGGVAGTGGVAGVAGVAGGVAGTGGAPVGGTGGAVGGTGGGVAPSTGFDAPGCEVADTSAAGPELHAAALSVLSNLGETMANGMPEESPCGFSSCHQGNGKAGLVMQNAPDLNMLLAGKQSCETATVPLVDPSGGQAALENSWIWIKMVGSLDATGALAVNPAWGMGMACGQVPSQPHGVRMPQNTTMVLGEDRLTPIRNWICAGAPGPM